METGDTGYGPDDMEKEADAKGDDGAKEKGFWCCGLEFGERTLKGRCGVVVGDFTFDFVRPGELPGGIGGGGYFSAYPASAILNVKIVIAVTSSKHTH